MKIIKFIAGTAGLVAVKHKMYGIREEGFVTNQKITGSQKQAPIIEWNTHLFSSEMAKYPFHKNAFYRPDPINFSDDPLTIYLNHLEYSEEDRAKVKGTNLMNLLNWH